MVINIFDLQDYFFRHIFAPETRKDSHKTSVAREKEKG